MRIVCLGSLLCLWFTMTVPAADVIITTDNGQKVLLRESGTWAYLPAGEAQASVPAAAEPAAVADLPSSAVAVAPDRQSRTLLLAVGGVAFLLLLATAGISWYFLILQPARKRRLLLAALEIIDRRQEEQYTHAEQLLDQAITSGLSKEDIREAYFARAFLLAKGGNLDGAAADLALADRADPAVLYLNLWIQVRLKKMKDAFDVYDSNKSLLTGYVQADTLMSLACFSLGVEHWKKQEIEAAVSYFDRVREMKVHAAKVPAAISDLQVTHGVMALFNGRADEAEKHFAAAVERAGKEKRSDVLAQLGLLLCCWRQREHPDQDQAIAKLLARIEKAKPAADAKTPDGAPPALAEDDVLRRNVCLLHAVSLLHGWFRLPEKKTLPKAEMDELEKRVARVSAVDPHMPDPKLLLGLIEYYFFEDRHDAAVAKLTAAGTDIPEISLLLKREAKLTELERDRLKTFFCMVRDYVQDHEVTSEMKQALLHSLEGYARLKEIAGELAASSSGDGGGATIQGMQSRGALLRKRVRAIVRPMHEKIGKEKVAALDKMVQDMESTTKTIRDNAEKLEKTELGLMVSTGEFLLKEETPAAADTAAQAGQVALRAELAVESGRESVRGAKNRGGRHGGKQTVG